MSKKIYILIAIIIACIVIILIPFGNKDSKQYITAEMLSGTWYATDASDKSITFIDDHTYTTENFFTNGTFQIVENQVKLINTFKDVETLTPIVDEGGEIIKLVCADDWTELEFTKNKVETTENSISSEFSSLYRAAIIDILCSSEWQSDSGDITFESDTLLLVKDGTSNSFSYNISHANGEENKYTSVITLDSVSYDLTLVNSENDDTYHLKISGGDGNINLEADSYGKVEFSYLE